MKSFKHEHLFYLQSWPNLSGHLNILIYIINKSFFTLLSITVKWTNLWIKIFLRLYLHEFAFNSIPQQLLCTKAKKISGSQGKET